MIDPLLHCHNNAYDRIQPAMNTAIEIACASGAVGVSKSITVNVNVAVGGVCGVELAWRWAWELPSA